jgi:hypothetical protein
MSFVQDYCGMGDENPSLIGPFFQKMVEFIEKNAGVVNLLFNNQNEKKKRDSHMISLHDDTSASEVESITTPHTKSQKRSRLQ